MWRVFFVSYTVSMKKYYYLLLGVFLLSSGSLFAEGQSTELHTPFSKKLEAAVQKNTQVQQNPGVGRLGFMRFYFPNNTVEQEPGFWARFQGCSDDTLVRAQAIYLYNMYVSTAAYKEDIPSSLTVNYVGVLDGFSKCARGFDVKDSVSFYKKHRTEIKSLLKQFFARRGLPAYQPNDIQNDVREKAFLNLLANTLALEGRFPVYRATKNVRLNGPFNQQDVALLRQFLQRALAVGRNKVISFENRQIFGPQIDTPIAHMKAKNTVTCHPVNEECAACSYVLGREMCAEISAKHRNWGLMRIYRVVAQPLNGVLKTASGENRFTLADGKKAEPWGYHVATLVIMNLDGKYTPYVVDKFLAGSGPISPAAWFQKFSTRGTIFRIMPFQRNASSENLIQDKGKARR